MRSACPRACRGSRYSSATHAFSARCCFGHGERTRSSGCGRSSTNHGMLDAWATFAAFQEPGFIRALFAQQRAFVRDRARFKAALCGRRAGKTETIAAWLLDAARNRDGALCPYIALSQKNARRIIWPTLQRVCRRHGVGAEFNEQTLECRLPNGSRVWVTGCDNRAQGGDFPGHPYPTVAIAQAGPF